MDGARAAFKLLEYIGKKECLTECCFTSPPSLDDLSLYQGLFRDFSLESLISCSASTRQKVYPLFLSAVGGAISVNSRNIRKVAAENVLRSSSLPSYVFFERGSFGDFVSIVDDLHAVVVTCSALRLKASDFLRMSVVSELQSEHFSLKNEGDKVYLYFSRICSTHCFGYNKMLRDLTSPLAEASQKKQALDERSKSPGNISTLSLNAVEKGRFHGNCFSLVKEVEVFVIWTKEQLTVIRDLLSAVPSLRDVIIRHVQVDNDAVSHINFTENLSRLILEDLKMTAVDAAFVACSLHQAPNLYSFAITNSLLHGDSVKFLCENLCHVPRLSYLRLSEVGMDIYGCLSLATSLKHVAQLTVLDLSKNSLGQGITELAKQLKNVPRLLHLNMERTNMGEQEAKALALTIKSDVSKLRTLQLGGNPLGRGVSVVVHNLSGLPDLKQLDLKDVMMTKTEIDSVSAAQHGIFMTNYHVCYRILVCFSFNLYYVILLHLAMTLSLLQLYLTGFATLVTGISTFNVGVGVWIVLNP